MSVGVGGVWVCVCMCMLMCVGEMRSLDLNVHSLPLCEERHR